MFPKEIKAKRELLEGSLFAFNLLHDALGELGRIVLQPAQYGGYHVSMRPSTCLMAASTSARR